jgi:hypothetical protein
VYSYCASLIMQVKETCVARGVSPFIIKAGAPPSPSPIMKACVSPFIMKVGVSHSVYRG